MRTFLLGAIALFALAADGCRENSSDNPDDARLTSELVSKRAPTPQHALNVRFEDKIRLLGYDLSDPNVRPDKPFKVTWYWSVQSPLPSGFQLFTHLNDGSKNRLNLDSRRALRRVYPEARWRAGDYLKDEQEVTIPRAWNSDTAVFYVGFYEGSTRLRIAQGVDDGERRAEVLRLHVARDGEPVVDPGLPRLVARRVTGPIAIDGKLDEPDWRAAESTGPFVNTMNGSPASFDARAQVLYDADKIYCAFVVKDELLKSTFEHDDDHLWEQDTVEVMFDPDGDTKNYFELQVSPRGVHFDTRYDSPRQPRPFGHVDWDSHVQAKVVLDGTLNDAKADR
ncbi:MAG TPA: carbohydrate-binding family 9-like protein, partial [Polyangiales bacterium]